MNEQYFIECKFIEKLDKTKIFSSIFQSTNIQKKKKQLTQYLTILAIRWDFFNFSNRQDSHF